MSHLECGSVVWVRLGQAWWPGTITTIAKCPPEFVAALRKTPIALVKFFHENEYQDVHKTEHIFPYNCERKEEFIRKGQSVNKNQSHGDVDLLAKFEADVVTAEKLTGGDMDILRTLVEGADTYKAFHTTHCPPTSPRLDFNNRVISGQPSQPALPFPCPAGVEFESRPQENLWPERVEAHTRLGCNTSKVRNPQNCQAASSDHQIAHLSTNSLSSVAASGGRDKEQTHPHLGGTPVLTKHCNHTKGEEQRSVSHLEEVGFSQSGSLSLKEQVTSSPSTRVMPLEARSEGKVLKEDEEEEEEEVEEEEDSLNTELNSEFEKLVESVDEDSLNLDLEMEGDEDEPEQEGPISEGEREPVDTDSDFDFPLEGEDEDDGSLALPGAEQENLAGSADDNEDSLMQDFDITDEDDDEVSERIDQQHPSQSWESEDDSEEELYRNLASASATDEDEVGWMQSGIQVENKAHNQMQTDTSTHLKGITGAGMNTSTDDTGKEEPAKEQTALRQEEQVKESCPSERTQGLVTLSPLHKPSSPSEPTPMHQTYHKSNCTKGQNSEAEEEEEEEAAKEVEDEDSNHHEGPTNLPFTTKKTTYFQDIKPFKKTKPKQHSKEPVTLDSSVIERPSTSKSSDILTFEGFDREKTKQASARLLMLLKATQPQPQRKPEALNANTVSKRRGRPPLKGRVQGRVGDPQGKKPDRTTLRGKRNQWHVSATTTTPITSDTDVEKEDQPQSAHQRSLKGRGSRGGGGWMKHRYGRGRPTNRKLRHSPLRRKTLHRQHNSTERSIEKRKTRSSNKEREKEINATTKKTRDSYERFAHSPDITAYSEAQPREPRNWAGAREKEIRTAQSAPLVNPPAKRPRKRKPSEVDNLLKWAVETGHTGSRNRGSRERHNSPTITSITTTATTTTTNTTTSTINNNNNNNNATRRSRLETKTANKTHKKRGRKKKVRRGTEEEKDEELERQRQAHTHSSSDDPLVNSEEELSDVGKTTVNKGRPAYPYKSGDLVWVQLETHWWPAYVDQVYPQTRRVSVYRVGLKQEASTKVDLARVKSFLYGEVPDFVDRSESGFTEALQVIESFCLLRNHGNKISSHKFFTMPPEEQDALIIVSFTPKDDPALTSPPGKRTRGQTRAEQQPVPLKGWYYESLNSDSDDGMDARGEDKYMSARDRRRMQKALRSRRRENEKLIKYMKSSACMEHLWEIFSGQTQCERHKLYQSEATRRSLLWSGIGPFQLDQDDDQILSVVDFLHTEMNKKRPDFNLAQDYVFKVWMPEAIKEGLRMVFKVPEDMLELALDEGYRENLTDRKTRRLDFV